MHGESVAWCEFIAIVAGLADIVITLLVIILYLRVKCGAEWLHTHIPVWVRRRITGIDDGEAVETANPLEGIEME